MKLELIEIVLCLLATAADGKPALEISSVGQFDWKYDDKGLGALKPVAVWRPKQLPSGFYSLGDVAMPMHDRAPSSVVVVKALTSDALRPPTSFVRVWQRLRTFGRGGNDGGHHDATFWRPIAPTGYTCLGHLQSLRSGGPPLDSIRCVKNAYVVEGVAESVWNNAGSTAGKECGVWQAQPRHLQSDALPTNTFVSRATHNVAGERFYLLNKNVIKGLGYATRINSKQQWEQAAQVFAPWLWLHPNELYTPASVDAFRAQVTNVKQGGVDYMTLKEPIGNHDNLNDNIQPMILRGMCSGVTTGCKAAPMYALIVDKPNEMRDIVYFFFYPYNRGKYVPLSPFYESTYYGDHVGDWEHYTVRFHKGRPYQIHLSAHGGGTSAMFNSKMVESMSADSHIFYSAWGSHANYLDAGVHNYKTIPLITKLNDLTGKGNPWLPTNLSVIWRQPEGTYTGKHEWLNYAGRWGNPPWACIKAHGVCQLEGGPTSVVPVTEFSYRYRV